jgi:predicted ATPase/DNA-binding SARP family transcriptional activator
MPPALAEPHLAFPASARPPVFLTALVGRAHHLEQVATLLRTSRLVTLLGAGGSGKTRLAAALATAAVDEGYSAAWVDLSTVSEADLVAGHVASTLGLREHLSQRSTDALLERIGTGEVLLVLDNCEHLLASCEALASTLLRGCSGLRILATSREPLRLAGERAWRVPPLVVPVADDDVAARDAAAVQLFAQRAGDVLPGFELSDEALPAVARICRRVDGLPLAIELAAARIPVLPPAQLADRLDDMFRVLTSRAASVLPRQRTLRGMMDWSYELLSDDERRVFSSLAVFAGGFTLDAAECILARPGSGPSDSGDNGRDDVLDLLATLVEKSLVVMREEHGEARYTLLEPVRQYAAERLAAADDDGDPTTGVGVIRLAHAAYYTSLAERLALRSGGSVAHDNGAASDGGDGRRRFAELDAEHDNLQGALGWALASGHAELALRLCAALRGYWGVRGHLSVGLAWSRRAADTARGDAALASLRTRALVAAAVYGRMIGEYIPLQAWLAEALSLARQLGEPAVLADVLTHQAVSLRDRGELAAARDTVDEAIGLWRGLDDSRGLATALGARASVALAEGDTSLARALRTEAAALARAGGDAEAEAHALIGLGEVARMQGDLDHARWCNEQCLALFLRAGDAWHAAAARHNLGWIEAQAGRMEASLEAFAASAATFRSVGNPFGLTLCLFGFARLLFRAGDVESAGVVLAAASVHTARVGVRPAAPADIVAYEETAAGIERVLSPEARAAVAARGRTLTLAGGLAWAESRLRALLSSAGAEAAADERTATTDPASASVPAAAHLAAVASVPVATTAPPTTAPPAAALAAVTPPDAADGSGLRVLALGPLHVSVAGRAVDGDAFGSSRPRELLLLLLCHPDGLTREQVGLAFWPESSTAQVKNSFHVVLHRLRRGLGREAWVVREGNRYRLDRALRIDFDVHRFETAVTAALHDTSDDGTARLATALADYRGDFLEGAIVGDWHLDIRDRLLRLCCDGFLALGDRYLAAGRLDDAATAFRAVLARDRLREEAYRGLMICQARSGQRVQALQLYDTLTLLLRDELGVSPDTATTALHHRLRSAEPL